jgi:hypothetical protein
MRAGLSPIEETSMDEMTKIILAIAALVAVLAVVVR